MTFHIPRVLVRGAAPLFIGTTLAAGALAEVSDRSATWMTASVTAVVLELATYPLLAARYWMANVVGGVAPRSEKDLAKPHFRLLGALGHMAIPVTGLLATIVWTVAAIAATPPEGAPDRPKQTDFSWGSYLESEAWVFGVALILYATCFRVRNRHFFRSTGLRDKIGPALVAVGHYVPVLTAVSLSVWTVLLFVFPQGGPLGAIRFAVLMVFIVGSFPEVSHSHALCLRCADQLRVDAPEYASTRTALFKIAHNKTVGVLLLVGFVASMFVGGMSSKLLTAAVALGSVALIWPDTFHRRYRPWCPICHPRNGGGGQIEMPDPAPSDNQPVPA